MSVPPVHSPLWQNGWYRWARRLDSPHFGLRPPNTAISLGIIHSISLPPNVYGTHDVADFFMGTLDATRHPYFQTIAQTQVSAHFYIQRTGHLTQFVSVEHRAWHAGVSSFLGVVNCNDYSVGIELEGNDRDGFEDDQYESLMALAQALIVQYPLTHWASHSEVAPGRKTDPGPGFSWARFRRCLG